jgi:hypothetical protein
MFAGVASPRLYTSCQRDPAEWLARVSAWFEFLSACGLRVQIPENHWEASQADGVQTTFPLLERTLGAAGLGDLASDLARVLSALLARFEPVPVDDLVLAVQPTGCTSRLDCDESIRLFSGLTFQQGSDISVVGTDENEDEILVLRLLAADASGVVEAEATVPIHCHKQPHDLLGQLDPAAHWRDLDLALQIALQKSGVIQPPLKWKLLPQMSDSLRTVPAAVRSNVIHAMMSALLPADVRPSGLAEHEFRVSEAANSAQRSSRWGRAWRCHVTKRGLAWRLHYWRGTGTVTFSNVCPKRSNQIFE